MFKEYQGDTTSSFSTVGDTAMMLFGMTLGEYEVFSLSVYTCTSLFNHLIDSRPVQSERKSAAVAEFRLLYSIKYGRKTANINVKKNLPFYNNA